MAVSTTYESIGPEKAKKYLESNHKNRRVRLRSVAKLALAIVQGEWCETHQGIAFDLKGRLIDGQHRLLAIVEAGIAVKMNVTRGLPEDAFKYVDMGSKRDMADRLHLVDDEQSNRTVNALVRAYLTTAKFGDYDKATVDNTENAFLEMADAFLEVAEAFRHRIPGVTRMDVGAAIVCYMHKHEAYGRLFLEQFVTGSELKEGSAVLALREALLARRVASGAHDAYWKAIQATRAHFENRKVTKLSAASEDWMGNIFTRMRQRRVASTLKGMETRKTTRAVAV